MDSYLSVRLHGDLTVVSAATQLQQQQQTDSLTHYCCSDVSSVSKQLFGSISVDSPDGRPSVVSLFPHPRVQTGNIRSAIDSHRRIAIYSHSVSHSVYHQARVSKLEGLSSVVCRVESEHRFSQLIKVITLNKFFFSL